MAARIFGIAATITRSAAPFLNSVAASWLMAWREVRSLMPMSTLPLPIGMHVAAFERGEAVVLRSGRPTTRSPCPAKSGWNL